MLSCVELILNGQKNEGVRILVICAHERCEFRAFASWNSNKSVFVIRSLNDEHSCNRAMSAKWLPTRYMEQIRDDPNIDPEVSKNLVYR